MIKPCHSDKGLVSLCMEEKKLYAPDEKMPLTDKQKASIKRIKECDIDGPDKSFDKLKSRVSSRSRSKDYFKQNNL